MDLIIKESDPRFNLLPLIFKKYSFDNIFQAGSGVKPKNKIYFIPELVANDYITGKVYLTKHIGAWVSRNKESILYASMGLSEEDYYLLIVKHTNDRDTIPICKECGAKLQYTYRFNIGYFEFCSNSCQASYNLRYQHAHPEDYPTRHDHTLAWSSMGREVSNLSELWNDPEFRSNREKELSARSKDYKFRTKFDYSRFVKTGNLDDECIFYIARYCDGIKIGVTSDINSRFYTSALDDIQYLTIHGILRSSRYEVANLEATIKLNHNGREFYDESELHDLLIEIKNLLATRPVANPFE